MVAHSIPAQRVGPETSSELTTLDGSPAPKVCAMDECTEPGQVRYFPHFRMTLCTADWIRVSDALRVKRRYW